MSPFYLIEQSIDKTYVHFNPKTNEYFVSDKILGAALFHEKEGKKFINDVLDDSWQLTKTNPKSITKANRNEEIKYFNVLH